MYSQSFKMSNTNAYIDDDNQFNIQKRIHLSRCNVIDFELTCELVNSERIEYCDECERTMSRCCIIKIGHTVTVTE